MGARREGLDRGEGVNRLKEAVLAVAAMLGSALSAALGGWDAAIQTLVICMALDYLSGIVVAGVFKRSDKSGDGALDSRAGFRLSSVFRM